MHNRPYKKSARIVGEVLGKYHPHGDTSVYDTMVRMAQEWSLRYMLVDGQGNYGSVDGDPPAAMRYTEARFRKITEEIIADIEKDTVDFRPNFDDSLTEPTVMPTRIPTLLMNEASGIAVGMATNMAPHNLTEVVNGILAYIDDKDIDVDGLMKHIKAPDFPTGGTIYGYEGVKDAFRTGRGRVVMRAKASIEPVNNRERIIVTEIPYQINKAEMIKRQWELCNEKKIEGITEIRDESNREGMRIVYELRSDAISNVVLNNLYKYSALQTSFSINNVVLVKGRPEMLNLKDMIHYFVEHRHDVVVRRTKFDLMQAEKRAHILEGLLIAQKNIEEVIKIIRESESPDAAKDELIVRFSLSEIQARAILDMRLRTLTGLEVDKLNAEYDELMKSIAYFKEILSDEKLRYKIIREELVEIGEKYGDERRTDIVYAGDDLKIEDMIADEDVVITISHLGYMKRTNLAEYRSQNRGGRGSKGTATRDEDFVEHMFIASTHNYILLFSEKGQCYWIRAYEVPEGAKNSKGRAIQNLISIAPDDKIKAFINIKNLQDEEYIQNNFIILCTKDGIIKKTSVEAYSRPRANGINAITIREGDVLLEAALTNGNNEIMIATKLGKVCRFPEAKVRPMGRNASGVIGIDLNDEEGGNNEVVGMICIDDMQANVLVVSEKGYGKRSDIEEYRITNRGGKGVKTINITEKTGNLVGIKSVTDANDLMIITKNGIAIRMNVSDLRVMGRATQGVRLINIQDSDSIAAVTKVDHEEDVEATVEGEITPEVPTGDVTPADNVTDESNTTPTDDIV
jgi:DNA gyrase subunit A